MNNSSNRVVMTALVLFVVGGVVVFLGNKFLWQPYTKAKSQLAFIENEFEKKDQEFRIFKFERQKLSELKKMSLPNDFDLAVSSYRRQLDPLLEKNGLAIDKIKNPEPPPVAGTSQKKARHTILSFDVRAKGTFAAVAKSLDALQRQPVIHRVKAIDLERAESIEKEPTGRLNVHLVVEGMIIFEANNILNTDLPPKPREIKREYAQLAERNPFLGWIPEKKNKETPFSGPDVPLFVVLDTIATSPVADMGEKEAFLSNRIYQSRPIRLRTQLGFDTFRIFEDDQNARPLYRGKVLRIDDREIYYQIGEDVYKLTMYQSLAQSMRHKLDQEELDSLELTSLVDAKFGKDSEVEAAKRPAAGGGNPRMGANQKFVADSKFGPGSKTGGGTGGKFQPGGGKQNAKKKKGPDQ